MATLQYKYDLDMGPGKRFPTIVKLSQYDEDFELVFRLYSEDGALDVRNATVGTVVHVTTAEIRGTKSDGNGYSATCDVGADTDGTPTVTFVSKDHISVDGDKHAQQMTAVAGKTPFELTLYHSETEDGETTTRIVSTGNFLLEVERSPLDLDTLPSDSVIRELYEIDDHIDDIIDAAETILNAIDPTLSVQGAAAEASVVGSYLNTTQIVATEQDPKDYNLITTPGKYANSTAASVANTANKPARMTEPHKLYVIKHTGDGRISQIILSNTTDPGVRIYKRFGSRSGSAPNYTWTWSAWNELMDYSTGIDATLTKSGKAADAATVGAYLNETQISATEANPVDYNTYTTPGKYWNGSQASVGYTLNKPPQMTSAPHKLYVIKLTTSQNNLRIAQVILANTSAPSVRIYKRYGTQNGETWTWYDWNEILDSVGGIDTSLTQESKAADAQVVGTKINTINEEIETINAVNEKVSVYCEGAYSYYGLRPYVLDNTGKWSTSVARHISINVKPNDVITIVGNRKYTSNCGFLKSDNAGSYVDIDYCANTSSETWAERKEVHPNEGITYIAPSDCNILCVTAYSSRLLDMLPSKIIINGTDYAFGLREETEEIFVDLYGVLKYYNPLPYIITGTDTFTWTTSTGRHLSINVKPEAKIKLTANSDYPTVCAFLKSDNYKPNETPDFCNDTETVVWQEIKSINAGATVKFTAPIDCHVLYLMAYNSTGFNQLPSKIVINGIDYTYDLRSRVDELCEYSRDRNWSYKKWACVGDSITAVNTKTSMHYHDYIHEETGITVVNMGIPGTGYKRHEASNRAYYQRVLNVPLDSDVITLFGSVNDVQNYETFGNVTDTTTDTVCGCINVALDNIFSILPAAPVGIIAPIPGWVSDQPTLFTRMEEYVDKMRQICEKRCVPFLDLFHSSNLHPWDAACRASTFSHDGGGGIHPDETGHKLIAGRVRVFLDSLMG